MSLEKGDFILRNYETDRVGETRTCRNWDTVEGWVQEEMLTWLGSLGFDESDIDKIQKAGDHVGEELWRNPTKHHG